MKPLSCFQAAILSPLLEPLIQVRLLPVAPGTVVGNVIRVSYNVDSVFNIASSSSTHTDNNNSNSNSNSNRLMMGITEVYSLKHINETLCLDPVSGNNGDTAKIELCELTIATASDHVAIAGGNEEINDNWRSPKAVKTAMDRDVSVSPVRTHQLLNNHPVNNNNASYLRLLAQFAMTSHLESEVVDLISQHTIGHICRQLLSTILNVYPLDPQRMTLNMDWMIPVVNVCISSTFAQYRLFGHKLVGIIMKQSQTKLPTEQVTLLLLLFAILFETFI